MELTIKGKTISIWSKKRILYTICFFLFCLIDQRTKTGSGKDGAIEVFRNLTGVVMALIIFSHYRWEEIVARKLPCLLWTVIGVAVGAAYVILGQPLQYFANGRFVAALDVLLFGYILIHTFISAVIDKKRPQIDKKLMSLWTVMMLLMIFSRSDYIWPLCYLVMFGCFYLTDFTKEEREDLFQGGLNGIILSLFAFQGYCCIFRPYDLVRYTGIYNNSNINALYYVVVLVAIFTKILYLTGKQAHKCWRILYWLGAGVVYAFLFMTIGRTAWLVSLLLGLIFLAFYCGRHHLKKFITSGMTLLLCFLLMFPVTFGLIRYLPPVFHHPVWFWGEWSEQRVHSWDPWNSEKYVDIDEVFKNAVGRTTEITDKLLGESPFVLHAVAQESLKEEPVLKTEAEYYSALLVRKTIYTHYLSELNLWGHTRDDQGFQLGPYYWVGHAHNIFLQYATDFGVPMAIVFLVLIIAACVKLLKESRNSKNVAAMSAFLFVLIPVTFGMLEYSWGVGSLTITMMFLAWRKAICDGE